MSTHVGPSIIENGLVLSLDAANPKSFRGEPTTNELVQVTWGGDGGPTVATVTDESLKYKGYFTQSVIGGTSNNCYLNGADLSASRTSTVWTFSCYLRREDKLPITSMNVYMYYPSSDGSTAATIENVGDGWYRLSRTRTGADSYISLAGFTGLVSGVKYYLSGAQLEKKSYPTAYVTTNTTRGDTVATGGGWADLSGNLNNASLLGGTSFNSQNNGSVSFDGVDDGISATASLATTGMTIGFWINLDNSINWNTRFDIFCTNITGGANGRFLFYRLDATTMRFHFVFPDLIASVIDIPNSNTIFTGKWKYVNLVSSTVGLDTTLYVYIDGVLYNYLVVNKVATATSSSVYLMKNDTAISPTKGNVGAVQAYNRALTGTEIKQNFNALKSRYGI